MKLFPPRKTGTRTGDGDATPSDTLQDISARLDRLERVVTDLKQNIDLIPAIIRKLYLDGVSLPAPYDLLSERFGYLSQNEEDGLLLALFKRIGATDHRFVEIGCGMNGGNSGFLAKECGWTGLMLEIEPERAARLRSRFAPAVRVVEAQVTRENINEIVSANGLAGDIDLLSIDIDSNDYWVWEALSVCRPRVVIVEYNPLFGTERAVTIPYDPQFNRRQFDVPRAAYYGASLQALANLGARKGYRLALLEPRGVNAFFVREDLARDLPSLRVGSMPIAPDVVADFGPEGVFPVLDRAGLALVDV